MEKKYKDICVNIDFAQNGVIVRANCYDGKMNDAGMNEVELVFKDLKSALKEIPSMVETLQEGKSDKPSKEEVDEDEKEINRASKKNSPEEDY